VSNHRNQIDYDLFDLASYRENPAFAAAHEDVVIRTELRASLVDRRKAMKMTQAQVAKRMDTTQSFVSEFENGGTDPHLSTVQRYGRAVGARLSIAIDSVLNVIPDGGATPIQAARRTHVGELEMERPTHKAASPLAQLTGPLGRKVRAHRAEIKRLAAKAGVTNVRVFGSVARGQETGHSDIDLLVDLGPGTGLFILMALRGQLERLLGAGVDLVPADSLKHGARRSASLDTVTL